MPGNRRACDRKNGVFRTEVVDAERRELGAVVPWRPRRIKAVSLALSVFVIVAAIWLLLTEYAQRVTVSGWIEPLSPPADVFSQEGGIVESVLVGEGVWIEAGDALATIGLDIRYGAGRSRAEIAARRIGESLSFTDDEIARLDVFVALADAQSSAREKHLRSQLTLAEERVALAERQSALALQKLGFVERLVERGSLAAADAPREEHAALLSQEALIARRQEVQRLRQELGELAIANGLRRQEVSLERLKLERELALGHIELDAIEARRRERIVAPLGGRVTNLRAEAGQRTDTRRPLMTIVPASSNRRAILLLPSNVVWKVTPGVEAAIRYMGVGIQEHGPVPGRVVGIGRAPLAGSRERSFRAEVDLTELPHFAANVPAGTEVEADLRLAAKPIWRWLAEPIRTAAARL